MRTYLPLSLSVLSLVAVQDLTQQANATSLPVPTPEPEAISETERSSEDVKPVETIAPPETFAVEQSSVESSIVSDSSSPVAALDSVAAQDPTQQADATFLPVPVAEPEAISETERSSEDIKPVATIAPPETFAVEQSSVEPPIVSNSSSPEAELDSSSATATENLTPSSVTAPIPQAAVTEESEDLSTSVVEDSGNQGNQLVAVQASTVPHPVTHSPTPEVAPVGVGVPDSADSSASMSEANSNLKVNNVLPVVSAPEQQPPMFTADLAQANVNEAEQPSIFLQPAARVQIGEDEIPARGVLPGSFEFPIYTAMAIDPSAPTELPITARYASSENPNIREWEVQVRACMREKPRLYVIRPSSVFSVERPNRFVVRSDDSTLSILQNGVDVVRTEGTATPVLFDGEPGRIVLNSNGVPVCPF